MRPVLPTIDDIHTMKVLVPTLPTYTFHVVACHTLHKVTPHYHDSRHTIVEYHPFITSFTKSQRNGTIMLCCRDLLFAKLKSCSEFWHEPWFWIKCLAMSLLRIRWRDLSFVVRRNTRIYDMSLLKIVLQFPAVPTYGVFEIGVEKKTKEKREKKVSCFLNPFHPEQ